MQESRRLGVRWLQKVIHLVDGSGRERYNFEDGGYLMLCSPNGDSSVVRCDYLDDTRMYADGVEQSISEFVDRLDRLSMWFRPVLLG